MKDQADKPTIDLFPQSKRRGRPVTGKAKTDAQRMVEYRLRKKQADIPLTVEYARIAAQIRPLTSRLSVIEVKLMLTDPEAYDALPKWYEI